MIVIVIVNYSGDFKKGERILDWLINQKDPSLDRIEEVDGGTLRKLIDTADHLAVYFCKYCFLCHLFGALCSLKSHCFVQQWECSHDNSNRGQMKKRGVKQTQQIRTPRGLRKRFSESRFTYICLTFLFLLLSPFTSGLFPQCVHICVFVFLTLSSSS